MRRVILVDLGLRNPNVISSAVAGRHDIEIVAIVRDDRIAISDEQENIPLQCGAFENFVRPRLDRVEADEAYIGLPSTAEGGAAAFYDRYFLERGIPIRKAEKTVLARILRKEGLDLRSSVVVGVQVLRRDALDRRGHDKQQSG